MCHYCHVLRHNPEAPPHRSINCTDKGNKFSKKSKQKIPDRGKPIDPISTCVICLDKTPNMTFIPCGHVATCESCSLQVQQCPMCRQVISARQKLFFV